MTQSPVDLNAVETTADYADTRAQTDPESIALVDGEDELSWREVRRESDRLAVGLLDRIGDDEVVFEQLPNGITLYLLRLACEKAGIRLLTVPSTFRENELAPLVEALSPSIAIVPGEYRGFDYVTAIDEVDDGSLRTVVALDGTGDATLDWLYAPPNSIPPTDVRIGPSGVSQLATTSGSSGTPTCVEVPVGARVRTGLLQAVRYDIDAADRIGVTTPLISGAPDATAYHGGPAAGVSIDLIDRFDPERLAERIRRGITVLLAVPTVTAKLLEYAEAEGQSLSLSTIVNYGDTLSRSVGQRAEDLFGCRVQQAFGTADYGGIAATNAAESTKQRLDTVGRPLEGNDVVLDTADGRIRSDSGVTGVAGDLLVDGSHRVGEPLVGEIEERDGYFRVGVQVQFDEGGRIVLLDRTKDVIIRGGRNVYPTEVENALASAPGVGRAAVVGVEDDVLGSQLVAFLVSARSTDGIDVDEVVAYLRDERNLAPFKLPERIVVVEALPMVPAGHKVDKRALRERVRSVDAEENTTT